jgi:type IV secretory pathway VirD2 relaxase
MRMVPEAYKAAKVHPVYLERDGVKRWAHRESSTGQTRRSTPQQFRTPMKGERRQFRFIISPQDGDKLDLAEFTRTFMKQVAKDTGRRLHWTAVNHHNTANPHVHVVVRGIDRDSDTWVSTTGILHRRCRGGRKRSGRESSG